MTTNAQLRATVRDRLEIAPEVTEALAAGRAVVALESTLISHGLAYPHNLDVASASEDAVRESGAVPATVAVRDGRLRIGLDAAALHELATAPRGSVMRPPGRPSVSRSRRGAGRRRRCPRR
jgi:pseudouridine-5'-phosphate glycosidase